MNELKRKLISTDLCNPKKVKSEVKHEKQESKPTKEVKCEEKSFEHTWSEHALLSEWQNIDEQLAKDLINLFDTGSTIPFIVRYRKAVTGNLSIEDLKDIKEKYEELHAIKDKAKSVSNLLAKQGKLNSSLSKSIFSATSIEEIDYIYAPYKPENKKTLAARAIALGLEDVAISLLRSDYVDLNSKVNMDVEGLEDFAAVEKGVLHIIAHLIATDTEVLCFIRKLKSATSFFIEVKKSVSKSETKGKLKKKDTGKPVDESKFENYFEFKSNSQFIKHHQVLAINRGEAQKVLTVKVFVPEHFLHKLNQFCYNKWMRTNIYQADRRKLLENAVNDSYTRLIQPLVVREVRSELKTKAEKASIDVFVQNLKQLLLMSPVKGQLVLGIDPGFTNGCKIALVSETGHILETDIIYPHHKKDPGKANSTRTLKNLMLQYKCSIIAIGNGTACRETEGWVSELISNKIFKPLDVHYTIVNENGASIYSCSDEAQKEFPNLDPNIISAVSLARRIQEPLAELVKVEPKHLGIGMYQHDLSKKRLENALDEVVSECVSFVGVDLNTTSQCLLRRVAGLTDKKASDIIAYREKNGNFKSRAEILKVNRIGKKIYEQCAGFLRVGPTTKEETAHFYQTTGTSKLDRTDVHPESYKIVDKLLKKLRLKPVDIGSDGFIDALKENLPPDRNALCVELKTELETLKLIIDSLMKPLNYDFRSELSQTPLFKKGLTNICDLNVGTALTGRVENCTHFGCFVDIGVGSSGLLHTSKFKGYTFQIGDQVEVKVTSIDIPKKHIRLEAVRKLT